MDNNLLEIKNLIVEYTSLKNKKENSLVAVKNVSLEIKPWEIYALAGESGCGKSTIAKSITKLVKPKSGDILFECKSILKHNSSEKKDYPKLVQMVFQNPYSSLNPKMKIGETLREPLDINTNYSKNRNRRNTTQFVP